MTPPQGYETPRRTRYQRPAEGYAAERGSNHCASAGYVKMER